MALNRRNAPGMTRDEANERLMLSRRTYFGWRRIPPQGRLEDTLRMVAEEIAILGNISGQFPEKAGTIGLLIQDWKTMSEEQRRKAN